MAFLLVAFIVATGIAGLVWAWMNYSALNKMEVEDINEISEERLLKSEHPSVV
jgi:hypothetical protein